ncbi:MAG: tRNA guanosine(34) transglycosylase Tgt [Candidatus Vogelbacteria bacterium]|nr:tRNA guanosine(34) transglycosylase Tgt [Candidatus Vogelbacteria bacterium]
MSQPIKFKITKELNNTLGRVGVISTPHGEIETPAFVTVGTKATVKALTPEQVKSTGAQVVLSNTYHLYLQPGADLVAKAGGLHQFMQWSGPIMTDSGGFQVFSLGEAFGKGGVSKVAKKTEPVNFDNFISEDPYTDQNLPDSVSQLAKIDNDGVTFRSHLDGSEHRLTPESSMAIQHKLGADIIFAFDECTSPQASYEYQQEALTRTHAWAKRSLDTHLINNEAANKQGLFGIVQGGRHQDLRERSAKIISSMDFAGFGIGGSFNKDDLGTAVGWVNAILPKNKPRHLLGIGEPEDFFDGVENGADTFDCVIPTRFARTGTFLTHHGRLHILNQQYREDFRPIENDCRCYTCQKYTRAYLAYLFHAKEMLGATLGSIHNIYFLVNLVARIRQSILDDYFNEFKRAFLTDYNH